MVKLVFDANSQSLALDRWQNIPLELRQRRQWAVSTLTPLGDGKVDKRPRRADGSEMDWQNPLQWLSFEEAINSGLPAFGFILTPADPFTIIDLDDKPDTPPEAKARHIKIFEAFPSYSERSQSGKGLHIILYGKIGGGMNRDHVEVYDQDRYIICTGDVVTPGAIQSHPEMLEALVEQMGGVRTTKELPETQDAPCEDDELIRRMSEAGNGARFKELFEGRTGMGSEHDAALFSILTFWTKNHDQVLRLFARSGLYRPRGEADGKKGHTARSYHETYLMETLAAAYSQHRKWEAAREADLEHGKALAASLTPAAPGEIHLPQVAAVKDTSWPPGLVGEVAEYMYNSAPRKNKMVAIAGALAFMAGICGRQFNVSNGVGLNLYITLLAESGMGKEAAKNGADRLFHHLAQHVPGVTTFIGPRAVSGPALEKAVAEHNPCFVTFVGEMGVRLQQMLAKRGGDPAMKAAWLGLYTAAVRDGRHQGAFHSNKDNRTADVIFPAVTIYGESTQSEYYQAISGSNFDDGFVPRFLTLTVQDSEIKPLNPNRSQPPSEALVQKLAQLVSYTIELQHREQYLEVRFPEPDTAYKVDSHYMQIASALPGGPIRTSWTRAPMQMFKVAALLAVGRNHLSPQISPDEMRWASDLVEMSIREVTSRYDSGDLGGDESKKVPAVEKAARDYMAMTDKQKISRKVPKYVLEHKHLIPFRYFYHKLRDRAEFRDSPRGMDNAIKAALQTAIEIGMLSKLTESQVYEVLNRKAPDAVYCLGDAWEL